MPAIKAISGHTGLAAARRYLERDGRALARDLLHFSRIDEAVRQSGRGVDDFEWDVAMDETIDGIRLINPGSLTRPRDGNSGSYALIETSPGKLTCRIIRLENDNASKKSSDKGGRLRKILNYSDRL